MPVQGEQCERCQTLIRERDCPPLVKIRFSL